MTITEVMMLLDQAVVKRLERAIANQFELNGWESGKFAFERALVNFDERDGAIAF